MNTGTKFLLLATGLAAFVLLGMAQAIFGPVLPSYAKTFGLDVDVAWNGAEALRLNFVQRVVPAGSELDEALRIKILQSRIATAKAIWRFATHKIQCVAIAGKVWRTIIKLAIDAFKRLGLGPVAVFVFG